MCVSVLQKGQYGEVWVFASTLYPSDWRKGYFLIIIWARV